MPYTPNQIVTFQYSFEDFTFTYLLDTAITAADVGKAVMIDPTGTSQIKVKLATAGADVFGRLETFEDRTQIGIKVGSVARKFRSKLPSTGSVAVGDNVIGSATAGVVTTGAVPASGHRNLVVETGTGYVIVEKF